jgi:hypothetical protein
MRPPCGCAISLLRGFARVRNAVEGVRVREVAQRAE